MIPFWEQHSAAPPFSFIFFLHFQVLIDNHSLLRYNLFSKLWAALHMNSSIFCLINNERNEFIHGK